MKNEKLIRSIGSVADKYIREAAPQNKAMDVRQTLSPKRKLLRYSLIVITRGNTRVNPVDLLGDKSRRQGFRIEWN